MGYPLVAGELELACDLVSSRIAWLDLSVAPGDGVSGRPTIDTEAVAAGDPTGLAQLAAWRERVEQVWLRTYGAAQPPHIAATFVLGWYLDALAHPVAHAAELGPWVLDVAPGAVAIQPHPTQGYPERVLVAPTASHQVVAAESVRRRRAQERYRAHAEAVASAYAVPRVRMSTRQRLGMVDDLWRAATVRARASARSPLLTPTGDADGDQVRRSCCFIYALPGGGLCSTCPRRTRRVPAPRST
ncbi:(2Fe-2S)-binding protein [Arsenicicoccus dermatophilus]|uniref:(2Fe-2S)-binding protein n=1 Tax=Arsenicicoccus dermatophilus TaxID=1076331 RepID=UPI001F4CAADC|nr:(2Fe-2S)-binding protein [Arsenicicoccus dermatophilus]MCH8613902.1 (2Fe-2S)-binding protein [Arsenicicoccus dermatophilus]